MTWLVKSTEELPEVINEFSHVAGYKINIQEACVSITSNEQLKTQINYNNIHMALKIWTKGTSNLIKNGQRSWISIFPKKT